MPECYHKLITKCWSNQVEERPTFDDIVKELKTNKQFITSTINEDEFRRFADNIEKTQRIECIKSKYVNKDMNFEDNEIQCEDQKPKCEDKEIQCKPINEEREIQCEKTKCEEREIQCEKTKCEEREIQCEKTNVEDKEIQCEKSKVEDKEIQCEKYKLILKDKDIQCKSTSKHENKKFEGIENSKTEKEFNTSEKSLKYKESQPENFFKQQINSTDSYNESFDEYSSESDSNELNKNIKIQSISIENNIPVQQAESPKESPSKHQSLLQQCEISQENKRKVTYIPMKTKVTRKKAKRR